MKTRTSIYNRTFAFAYVLLVAVIFCGCKETPSEKTNHPYKDYNFAIVEIDSCEYVVKRVGNAISHKGNCKFCAERSKK